MKTLLLLLFLISCEKSTQSTSSESKPHKKDKEVSVVEDNSVQKVEIIDGTYKSECILDGLVSHIYLIYIANYEITVSKTLAVNDRCEGMQSVVMATYNVNGDSVDFVETTYTFMENAGGSYICGQSQMTSGDAFNIDGIGCGESFENIETLLTVNGGNYFINGIEFHRI